MSKPKSITTLPGDYKSAFRDGWNAALETVAKLAKAREHEEYLAFADGGGLSVSEILALKEKP